MRAGSLVALAVLGGLLLAGGAAADWVVVESARQVGGISVPDVARTPGLAYAPLAVPLGILALLASPALAQRRTRRVAGVLLLLTGAVGLVVLAAGMGRAAAREAGLAAGPAVASLGAVALIAVGALAFRRPAAPALSSRYTVEGAEDQEWQLASDEEA